MRSSVSFTAHYDINNKEMMEDDHEMQINEYSYFLSSTPTIMNINGSIYDSNG
jgi:hypothetical protein